MKYGIIKHCGFCNKEFETRIRFIDFCSTPCKNPINRKGNKAWNKGIKLTEEQKSKLDTTGLSKSRGWNKGKENSVAKQRFLENNPNKDGRLNNLRPRKIVPTEYTNYLNECKKSTYRSVRDVRKEGVAVKTGKRKTDMQLDHIIPYKQGYDLNISPSIMGSRKNLRYILGVDNRKKWDTYQNMETIMLITGGQYGLQ